MCEIDNLIMQHWSAVTRHSFLETVATLESLGVFGFAGIFFILSFCHGGQHNLPRTCSISTLGYSQAGIFLWSQCQKCLCLSGNLPLSTGQCDPTTGTIAPRKGERTPGTPKASVRDSAESLSPLHWIYPHPCKKTARCFNYKTQPKITSLIPRQMV